MENDKAWWLKNVLFAYFIIFQKLNSMDSCVGSAKRDFHINDKWVNCVVKCDKAREPVVIGDARGHTADWKYKWRKSLYIVTRLKSLVSPLLRGNTIDLSSFILILDLSHFFLFGNI